MLSLFQLSVFLLKTEYSEVDWVAVREAVKIYNELLHGPGHWSSYTYGIRKFSFGLLLLQNENAK